MEQAKRVAKNTGFLYARMAITVFISLYVTRLVLAALGAEDFGTYNLVAGIVMMLVFLNSAMASASQRFMSYAQGEENELKQKQIFNVSVLLHLIIGVIVVVLIEIVGFFLFDGILQIDASRREAAIFVFHFMVISTFFSIITVPYDAVINARENMLYEAIIGVVESLLKLGIAIIITYYNQDKLILYGLLMALLSVFILIVKQIYCYNKYEEVEINFKKHFKNDLFKEMSGFAGWSFLGTSTSMVSSYGQGIVLNMFFGTIVNAAQGIAGQVSGQLGAFSTTMLKALNPVIAKNEGAGKRDQMVKASTFGGKISFFLLVFFYTPIMVEMPYVFGIWLKEVPIYTVIFCQLLLSRNLIDQLFITLSSSIQAVGKIKSFQIWNSIFNLLPLLISYILFSYSYEPYYLYIVFILHSLIKSITILIFSKKIYDLDINDFLKNIILKCVLSFIIITSISYIPILFFDESFLRFVGVLFLSTISFFVIFWSVAVTSNERNYLKKLIFNFRSAK